MGAFLDDPDITISGKGEFRKEIEKLRIDFNLNKRWYHPLCHIVLFSIADWLHSPITAFVEKASQKSNWKRPGIVIRVSENISKKRFIRWLDENWNELRERLKKELGIKRKKGFPKKNSLRLTQEIIRMREKGMRFKKISSELEKKYGPTTTEYNTVIDPKLLEKRYARYRKLFGLKSPKIPHKK